MSRSHLLALGVAATALLAAAPASAWHRHHAAHAHRHSPPDASASSPGYYPAGGWEAEANARATAAMQAAPGVTNELAPDAKETATGGPVGGVPGFSGGH